MADNPNYTDFSDFLQASQMPPSTGMSPLSPSPLDPAVQAQLAQSPEGAFQELLKKHFYHMSPDQTEPNKKQKALGILQTLLSAAAGSKVSPQQRLRAISDQEYPEQTQRIAQNVGEQRAQNQLVGLQNRIALQQDQLQSLNQYRAGTLQQKAEDLAEKQRNNQLKNDVATVSNSIRKMRAISSANVGEKQAALLDTKNKIAQFQADHPDMKPGQVLSLMVDGSEDPGEVLKDWQLFNQAKGIGSVVDSQSKPGMDAAGNPTMSRHSVRTKMFGGQAIPTPSTGPYVNPQFAPPQNPGMPQGTANPAPQPGNPGQPQANGNPQSVADIAEMFANPNAPLNTSNIKIRQAQQKQGEETGDEIRKLNSFKTESDLLTNALLSAASKGGANWRGLLAGHPIVRQLRETYGNVSPENAIDQAMQNFNALGSLKSFQPRFSTQEYSKVLQAGGGAPHTSLENAVKFSSFQTMRAELEAAIRGGKLKPEDAGKVSAAMIEEMNRLGSYARDASANGKANPIQTRSLLDIMKGRSDAGRSLGSGRSRVKILE